VLFRNACLHLNFVANCSSLRLTSIREGSFKRKLVLALCRPSNQTIGPGKVLGGTTSSASYL